MSTVSGAKSFFFLFKGTHWYPLEAEPTRLLLWRETLGSACVVIYIRAGLVRAHRMR